MPSKTISKIVETKLFQVVSMCLIEMQARRLDFTPSSENMPVTAEVMTKDLFREGYTDDDCERIKYAIDAAGRAYPRFPTVFHVKQFIKTRSQIAFEKEEPKKQIQISDEARIAEHQKRISVKNKAMEKIRCILSRKTHLEKEIKEDNERRIKLNKDFIKKYLHDEDVGNEGR